MTRRFIKKALEIEAFRLGHDDEPEWFHRNKHVVYHPAMIAKDLDTCEITNLPAFCMIQTLEGAMRADIGDYIIQGIKGDICPCKADIFEESYQEVMFPYVVKVSHPVDTTVWSQPGSILPPTD